MPLFFLFLASTPLLAQNEGLDPSFGTDGQVLTDIDGTFDRGAAVVVQPDGKIVVGGTVGGTLTRFGLVRYNADGSLDDTFGNGGIVRSDAGIDPVLTGLVLHPNGTIFAVGNNYPNGFTEPDPLLAFYDTGGLLDAPRRRLPPRSTSSRTSPCRRTEKSSWWASSGPAPSAAATHC